MQAAAVASPPQQAAAVASPPQQAAAVASRLSPKLVAFVRSWPLPGDQADIVNDILGDNLVTTLELLAQLDVDDMMSMDGMQRLKVGAKLVVKNKLSELKVGIPAVTGRGSCIYMCECVCMYVHAHRCAYM